MTEPKQVMWTKKQLNLFKIIYEKYKDMPEEVILFEGNEYLIGYAKYLIQYLEGRFEK